MTLIPGGVFRRGEAGFIAPGTDAWSQIITPSKVAAILGASRWESPFSLWQRMKGNVPAEEPKDVYAIGHDYEPAAANRWARRNEGWRISSGEVQFHIDPTTFGFPAVATLDRRASRGSARRCVEFKVARDLSDMDKWGDDFTGDCPDDYWTQVQAQMLFTGWTRHPAQLMALGPFWNEGLYTIPFDPVVAEYIVTKCREFWESLAEDVAPPLDNSVPTYECVRAMHPDIVRDSEVELSRGLANEYRASVESLADAEKWARETKTRVLDAMGDAHFAMCEGQKVARRQPSRGSVALYTVKSKKSGDTAA